MTRQGAEGFNVLTATLKELEETTRAEGGPVEEGERIDRCPNGVGLVEGAVSQFDSELTC